MLKWPKNLCSLGFLCPSDGVPRHSCVTHLGTYVWVCGYVNRRVTHEILVQFSAYNNVQTPTQVEASADAAVFVLLHRQCEIFINKQTNACVNVVANSAPRDIQAVACTCTQHNRIRLSKHCFYGMYGCCLSMSYRCCLSTIQTLLQSRIKFRFYSNHLLQVTPLLG